MSAEAKFVSRYDQRVELVRGILKQDTKLDAKNADALAIRLLHALDATPEKLR
ncbi:DUF6307 family protein [Amycolatopsis nigrescens]|uniref:DUF6307 family protein n=1 Tax=Amycolatopsis nigrescens TaxID=381445 RepID=UPI0003769F73|nr:DUF6307 family protein [Amycolatopsis nigrescens]